MKNKKKILEFYGKNYKPTKNSIPVDYKGTHYLSKAQCIALEGSTRKELDEYLKNPKKVAKEIILEEDELEGFNI